MKRFILCVLGVLAFAAAAEADSDRIMMDTSTAPLGAGETYSTDTFLAESYKYAAVTVVADEDSAGGGVKIEQSCDEDCDTAAEPGFQYVSSWSYTAGSLLITSCCMSARAAIPAAHNSAHSIIAILMSPSYVVFNGSPR
jgi:hypothetical protein